MPSQVQVHFESFHPTLIGVLPEHGVMLPVELSPPTIREALSTLVSQTNFDAFDFVIDGQLLTGTLEAFLSANKWSSENLLTILLIPHVVQASKITTNLPTNDDWISAITMLSSTKMAFGSFSGMLSFTSVMENGQFEEPQSISLDSCFPIKSLFSTSALLVASHGQKTSIIDIETRQVLEEYSGHTDTVESSVLIDSSDRKLVFATGSYDRSIRVSQFSDTIENKSTLTGHSGAVTGLAALGQESKLVSASLDGTSRIWDLETSEVVTAFPHEIPLLGLASAATDANLVAAFLADMSIRVWDVRQRQTASTFRSLKGHSKMPTSVIFSSNTPTSLYSVGQDNVIKTWDLRVTGKSNTDKSIGTLQSMLSSRLLAIAECPSTRSLIAGGDRGLEYVALSI